MEGLTIFLLVMIVYNVIALVVIDGENIDIFKDLRDLTVGELLFRFSILPWYLLCLAIVVIFSPVLIPMFLYLECDSVKNFFNKKPLQFLKNYSIKIERK